MKTSKKTQSLALAFLVALACCHTKQDGASYTGWRDKGDSGAVSAARVKQPVKQPVMLAKRTVRSGSTATRKVTENPAILNSASYDVTQTGHVTAKQLEQHFARYGGVLQGKGLFFIEMEKKYNVSALFMAAIATQESSAGKSARARRVKDSFGMTGRRGKRWASHEENIEDAFKLVSGGLYVKSGRKTPSKIGSRYCTTGGWATKVTHHMKGIVSNN